RNRASASSPSARARGRGAEDGLERAIRGLRREVLVHDPEAAVPLSRPVRVVEEEQTVHPRLALEHDEDVLVVGGLVAGIRAAARLRDPERLVVDAELAAQGLE